MTDPPKLHRNGQYSVEEIYSADQAPGERFDEILQHFAFLAGAGGNLVLCSTTLSCCGALQDPRSNNWLKQQLLG